MPQPDTSASLPSNLWVSTLNQARFALVAGNSEQGLEILNRLQYAMEQEEDARALRYHPSRPPKNDGSAERQYLDVVADILDRGTFRPDRTGTGTYAIHGATMRYDLSDGTIPLLTTKRIPWKAVIKELIWFLNGETNIRPLIQAGVHIWSDWPYKK